MRRLLRILRNLALMIRLAVVVLAGVVAVNTWRQTSQQIAVAPLPKVAVDSDAAAQRLAAAIRFQTISSTTAPDASADPFREMQAHIAASLQRPVLCIFGPTVLDFGFRPWNDKSQVVEEALLCRPCGPHGHARCPLGHHNCMKKIKAEFVYDQALATGAWPLDLIAVDVTDGDNALDARKGVRGDVLGLWRGRLGVVFSNPKQQRPQQDDQPKRGTGREWGIRRDGQGSQGHKERLS